MVGSIPSSRADAGGQLLRELEALSQALYKAKGTSRREQQQDQAWHSHSQGLEVGGGPELLDRRAVATQELPIAHHSAGKKKKKGGGSGRLWDWKPLRALAHIGQTRFECEFVAHVHGMNKVPVALEGLRLEVRLRHKEIEARTVPSLVFKGAADFEEALRIKCAVYGSASSSGGVRYMSKAFTLSVVAPDAGELELGKHRLDLTRILPDQGSSVTKKSCWNTSFKLSGRAKGGILVVTFGYDMGASDPGNSPAASREESRSVLAKSASDPRLVRSFSSLPSSPQGVIALGAGGGASPAQSEPEYSIDVENLNLDEDEEEDPEEATASMTMNSSSSGLLAPDTPGRQQEQDLKDFGLEQSDEVAEELDEEDAEFSVVDQGVEESSSLARPRKEEQDGEGQSFYEDKRSVCEEPGRERELEFERDGDELDDEAEKFLHMLGSSDSEEGNYGCSPRGLLLRQFEQEQQSLLAGRGFATAMEEHIVVPYQGGAVLPHESYQSWRSAEEDDDDLSAFVNVAESELQKAAQAMKSKARAKMLEDAEAEALMQEWGLNERAFQRSPPKPGSDWRDLSSSSSLVAMAEPPCLAEGLGSMIPMRDGGSLRTMNPIHFQGGRNDGRLVLQVSKTVVVPAEMGSGVLDIFRSLAAGGAENMALQVMGTMPLEDITGKNIYQIAMEGQAALEAPGSASRYPAIGGGEAGNERLALEYGGGREVVAAKSNSSGPLFDQRYGSGSGSFASSRACAKRASSDDTYMSLEDLAPVAMEKIEALAMQGLKIQSDMAEEEAPYAIEPSSTTNLLESGSSSLHLLEAPGAGAAQDSADTGLMAMSISLDEWMRLDAGVYDEAETTDKTKAVLAAHHAAHSSDIVLLANCDDQQGGGSGVSCGNGGKDFQGGLMGDTLTLAMLVQLRDPLRNFEPVGSPMMAFVQAERVLVPPRPKMFKRVSLHGNSEVDDEEEQQAAVASQFKITGVHMAGLKPSDSSSSSSSFESSKKKMWGTQRQQQSGSRWLLAHGMGKTGGPKHPLLKSKISSGTNPAPAPAPAAPTPNPPPAPAPAKNSSKGESLWSISARVGSKAAAATSITRNPDVKFGSRLSLGKKKW